MKKKTITVTEYVDVELEIDREDYDLIPLSQLETLRKDALAHLEAGDTHGAAAILRGSKEPDEGRANLFRQWEAAGRPEDFWDWAHTRRPKP